MQYDFTIKITDVIMIAALVAGPIAAVWVSESRRRFHDQHERRVRVFRTLMATRLSCLAVQHVEALNLVELEFHTSKPQDKKVVDCWKIYLSHMNNALSYAPKEGWDQRRQELLIDLLYEMGLAIGYSFDKSSIKSGSYSPQGYLNTEMENNEIRKLWLDILRGNRGLPMAPFRPPTPPPPPQDTPHSP
ncbi:MAG: DUF6680 family protein [Verrucomicrobiota bacterium]|jgi:hypothetical protein